MGEGVGALRPLGAPETFAAGHRGLFLDLVLGKLAEKARRNRACPLAVDSAVGGVEDGRAAAGAGQRDIGEAAFLLEGSEATFFERALRRKDAFLPAWKIDDAELEALGSVDGHDRHAVADPRLVIVHDQADMLEE